MKKIFLLILSFSISLLCISQTTHKVASKKKTIQKSVNDSVKIVSKSGLILRYSKKDYASITKYFNKIFTDNVSSPQSSFSNYFDESSKSKPMSVLFGGESGEDEFSVLYAHFLKKQNGEKKYETVRNELYELLNEMHNLYSYKARGGTYLFHLGERLESYVEYELYTNFKEDSIFVDKVNVAKQRELYIKLLRQQTNDFYEIYGKDDSLEETERRKKICNEYIDKIEKYITKSSYLNALLQYQYRNY
jgi:hypothetical protein